MKILSLFSRPSLKRAWTFTPKGTIWRLLPTDSGEFVGESRDQDLKQVSFFAVHSVSGNVLWNDLALDEPWWVGIEDTSDGVVLLHGFASPDMPQHKGVVALELRTGKRLWENKEYTYWFVRHSKVVVYRMMFEKRTVAELDIHSGEVVGEYDAEHDVPFLDEPATAERINDRGLSFPDILDLNATHLPAVRFLSKAVPPSGLEGDIEFASTEGFVVAGYHRRSGNSDGETRRLENCVKVISTEDGRVVFEDTLARDSRGPVPDSFFLRNEILYYIKDQRTLTAVPLKPTFPHAERQ